MDKRKTHFEAERLLRIVDGQIHAVTEDAGRRHVSPFELRDTNGNLVMPPLIHSASMLVMALAVTLEE